MDDHLGRYVKIFLKNGHVFHGSILLWEDGVKLKSVQNEIVIIPDIKEICAYVFIQKPNGNFLIDESIKKEETIEEDNKTKDLKQNIKIQNLKGLHKLKIESERQLAKIKLKSPIATAPPVEYGDTISILRTLKNDSSK